MRDRGLGLTDHRLDRGLDLFMVKRGQHDPPGAVVIAGVDRQQAVAEQRDQIAEAALAPVEVVGMRDRDVVVGGGPEHENHRRVHEAQGEYRPELLVGREQDRQRVVGHPARAREIEVRSARGIGHARLALAREVLPDPPKWVERDGRRARIGLGQAIQRRFSRGGFGLERARHQPSLRPSRAAQHA